MPREDQTARVSVDKKANFLSDNRIVNQNEIVFLRDAGEIVIGDGKTRGGEALRKPIGTFANGTGVLIETGELISPRAITTGGLQDIYTVPEGKQAYFASQFLINPTGSTKTYTALWKRNGVYRRTFSAQPAALGAFNGQNLFCFVALEPGDSIAVNADAGLVFYANQTFQFSRSIMPQMRTLVVDLSTTEQTLYTVPAGKKATGIALSNLLLLTIVPTCYVINDSGVTHAVQFRYVPNGETPAPEHILYPNVSVASGANAGNKSTFPSVLNAGDRIMVQSDNNTPGAHVRLAVLEFDA
jgi:hypothetical protein